MRGQRDQQSDCERCGGDGYIATGPVIGGLSIVSVCPKCNGKKVREKPSGSTQ